MHSMAFICHVFHGKDLSLHVLDNFLHTSPIESMLNKCDIQTIIHSFESAWKVRASWRHLLRLKNVINTRKRMQRRNARCCDQ